MDEKRVEGYRNFATKLWNATRYCQSNGIGASSTVKAPPARLPVSRWIISEMVEALGLIEKAMTDLRFDAAANAIYHFVWDVFCDQYLEEIKSNLASGVDREEHQRVAGWILDQILVMLHPFMPFITEELWQAQGEREYDLILAHWPNPRTQIDESAMVTVRQVISTNNAIWSARSELGISPSIRLDAWFIADTDATEETIVLQTASLKRRGRIGNLYLPNRYPNNPQIPDGAHLSISAGDISIIVPLEGIVDIDAEKARLEKALAASQKEAKSLEGRLSNANFVERAKPEAVEKAKADFAHHSAEAQRLEGALARLG